MVEQDAGLVAYFGLYYGDCVNHKGEIADLARDLRKKMREAKYANVCWIIQVLQGIQKLSTVLRGTRCNG